MMAPEIMPTIGPAQAIIKRGELSGGMELIMAASLGRFAMYWEKNTMCTVVTQTLFTMPTSRP